MTRFAPVAPIQILEAMKMLGVLGNYHLLLAHHVLECPERFHDLFDPLTTQSSTIIMDNSIVELGASENESKVLAACNAILAESPTPHEIIPVLTDVMGDGAATRAASALSYEYWTGEIDLPLMVVLQGADWKDFCLTVDTFLANDDYPAITWVGIPRKLTENVGSRQMAVQYVRALRPDINIHLLGFSNDVVDDVICARMECVAGIDSAVPLRYNGIYTPTAEVPPRPADWFEHGQFNSEAHKNLVNMRQWIEQ